MKWSFDIMGDVHKWILDHPYVDAPNVTRVAVDNGVPSVRVTIRNDPVAPFTFDESPLMVQSDVCAQPGAELLDARQLAPLVDAAIWGLSQSGIPDAVKTLSGSEFAVVDLPDGMLGGALPNSIQIDVDAAGFGWFIDAPRFDNAQIQLRCYDRPVRCAPRQLGRRKSGPIDRRDARTWRRERVHRTTGMISRQARCFSSGVTCSRATPKVAREIPD